MENSENKLQAAFKIVQNTVEEFNNEEFKKEINAQADPMHLLDNLLKEKEIALKKHTFNLSKKAKLEKEISVLKSYISSWLQEYKKLNTIG